MPIHNFQPVRGRIETIEIDSEAISNNILGDSHLRQVAVYLPEGYDQSAETYPLLVDIAGFTGSGLSHIAWKGFGESLPQRIERLISEGEMGKLIVAFPDCFTSLGGNQYINSSVMGNWADFLTKEMLPELEGRYRVKPGRDYKGLFGKSSGGYGALVHGMLYADYWGAVACHSGDMAFNWAYMGDFPKTLMHLAPYDGNIKSFIRKMENGRKVSGGDMHTLMILAMAASYDPAPELPYGIRLPVDMETCEVDPERWAQWLRWDPIELVKRDDVVANLVSLKGLFIDCGNKDQYSLLFGARVLDKKLRERNIGHCYEEFSDNHSGVDYRMDVSLPFLYEKLMAA